MTFLQFLDKYNGMLAVIVAVLVAICGFVHYILVRRAEERGKQYDRYHGLLEDLNISARGDGQFIDRQIAVVYEMRNFEEYWPVSLRILERSLPEWRQLKETSVQNSKNLMVRVRVNTLYDEALLTIRFIERRREEKSYLCIAAEDR